MLKPLKRLFAALLAGASTSPIAPRPASAGSAMVMTDAELVQAMIDDLDGIDIHYWSETTAPVCIVGIKRHRMILK